VIHFVGMGLAGSSSRDLLLRCVCIASCCNAILAAGWLCLALLLGFLLLFEHFPSDHLGWVERMHMAYGLWRCFSYFVLVL
jgi:hypothetical protein